MAAVHLVNRSSPMHKAPSSATHHLFDPMPEKPRVEAA